MKTIISVLLAIFVCGCGLFQKPEITDQHKACAAVCGALDAARCWDEPNFVDIVNAGADLGACFTDCMADEDLATRINVQCLAESRKCDLGKCVEVVE